jgi:hypothetical protein
VPARLRDDWRLEWEGELAAAWEDPETPIVRHALGSFIDAFWIRQREVADLRTIDDLRHGLRQWRQQSNFVITAVGILALSMAASVTAFSVVSQILLRPLPYPDPDRIVTVRERQPATPGRLAVAPGNFVDWRARATSFTQLAGAGHTVSTTPAAIVRSCSRRCSLPRAIGGAAALMFVIAAFACYIPARRAAGEDPIAALRVD